MSTFKILGPFILLVGIAACKPKANYQIEERYIEFSKTENCTVLHRFPEVSGIKDSLLEEGLNRYFRQETGLFRAAAQCLEDSQRLEVISSYLVLSQSESLLSVELQKRTKSKENGENLLLYYPLSIRIEDGHVQPLELLLSQAEWAIMTNKLKSWREEDPKNRIYNEASYEWGNTDLIPYGLSSDSLILYPGGEGETHSKFRLPIALEDLKE